MAFLYVNIKGEPWRKHSYSAGNDFDQSPQKYFLRRVMGWKEKDNKAAFLFGRAFEKSVEFYHDNAGKGIIEKFQELWLPAKEVEGLRYTKVEKDWETLNRIGTDMVRLYVIMRPSLPIPLGGASVFQREYSKEVFPGDPNYGEIEDAGKLDIVCYVDPAHPKLVRVDWKPEYGPLRPLIVDMKTSGVDFPENPGIAAFDKQLRRYSWQSGIRDVALLWAVKKGLGYKKGSRVTLLVDAGDFKAGWEVFVADVSKDDPAGVYVVGTKTMLEEMDRVQGRKADGKLDTTKAAVERKKDWVFENAPFVRESDFTRQRLQFNAGFVSEESANDAGLIAGRQIVQIVNSWKNNQWPNTFGIRFPHDDRNDPYFRAFVLKDEAFKAEYFKQSDPQIDDLFEDDPEEEGQPDE
jgi:hypothetical protein